MHLHVLVCSSIEINVHVSHFAFLCDILFHFLFSVLMQMNWCPFLKTPIYSFKEAATHVSKHPKACSHYMLQLNRSRTKPKSDSGSVCTVFVLFFTFCIRSYAYLLFCRMQGQSLLKLTLYNSSCIVYTNYFLGDWYTPIRANFHGCEPSTFIITRWGASISLRFHLACNDHCFLTDKPLIIPCRFRTFQLHFV